MEKIKYEWIIRELLVYFVFCGSSFTKVKAKPQLTREVAAGRDDIAHVTYYKPNVTNINNVS